MTTIQAIILGIVQGITEFLPISSSGHLVLIPNLFSWDLSQEQAFAFDVLLQAATLIAVVSFFLPDLLIIAQDFWSAIKQKNLSNPNAKMGLYLIITTIPAGIIGLSFNGFFASLFNSPQKTTLFLLINSILLYFAETIGSRKRDITKVNWIDSICVGCFQVFALFPGISRSGVTITGGMLRGLDRESAARFSFLISVPLLAAAGLNGFHNLLELPNTMEVLPNFLVGSIVSAVVGYFSIKWLLRFLSNRSLYYFAVYCSLFAVLNIIIIFQSYS
jgi:undecaprenyl-diphosphatase